MPKQEIKRWLNYWVVDPFWGAIDYLTVFGLRLLSMKQVSNIGAMLGSLAGKYRFSEAGHQAGANLQHILPEKSTTEIKHMIEHMWEGIGRTFAEMSILDKIGEYGKIEVIFPEDSRKFETNIPTIFLFTHIGNWELHSHYVVSQNCKMNVVYERLPNRFHRDIAKTNRQRTGVELISPDYAGTRKLYGKLQNGEIVALAMDEFKKEKVISPALHRPIAIDSNIVYAVKLAKKFKARVIFGSCLRVNDFDFKLYYQSLDLDLDKGTDELTGEIDELLERWVRKNPEQWYMLHRSKIN